MSRAPGQAIERTSISSRCRVEAGRHRVGICLTFRVPGPNLKVGESLRCVREILLL